MSNLLSAPGPLLTAEQRRDLEELLRRQHFHDPVAYAQEVLGVRLWAKQIEILQALTRPPHKVLVLSGHNVGKTFVAAVAVNWWFDTRNPGVAITTAPTNQDVRDLLWKEIRMQRGILRPSDFAGPQAPVLYDKPDHYAKGFTAEKGESFQGRHDYRMLFVFDEATGIAPIFWLTTKTMFRPGGEHAWLAIFNPTDTSTQAFLEYSALDDRQPWTIIQMSCLDHPNIAAELRGDPPPFPNAVTYAQLNEGLRELCQPVLPRDQVITDVEWPPGSGRYLRPGPEAEARWLGRWPSQGIKSVWSDSLWQSALRDLPEPTDEIHEIGCDVARQGDDWTAFHVRRGPVSIIHESYQKQDTMFTVGRLIELARWCADVCSREHPQRQRVRPEDIPLKVDSIGFGAGVVDRLAELGYNVLPVDASSTFCQRPNDYKNKRSELWFQTADRARAGQLSLSRLDKSELDKLRQQALAPEYKINSQGQRELEPKDKMKERLKRSPDDMDALNLAYYDGGGSFPSVQSTYQSASERVVSWGMGPHGRESNAERRGLYGR
jgi:hypothetical protein